MIDYRSMSPCERISYYKAQIKRLTSTRGSSATLLVETFRRIIRDNADLCSGQEDKQRKA